MPIVEVIEIVGNDIPFFEGVRANLVDRNMNDERGPGRTKGHTRVAKAGDRVSKVKGSMQGCLRNENKPTREWPLIMRKKMKAHCLHLHMPLERYVCICIAAIR